MIIYVLNLFKQVYKHFSTFDIFINMKRHSFLSYQQKK